jgi:hypothetical protein
MIDEAYCLTCTEKKSKLYSHMRGNLRIYKNVEGKEWSGTKCPDCYAKYKKEYDKKRRLKKGHVPLGNICVCSVCNTQFEMENGKWNKICSDCRKAD